MSPLMSFRRNRPNALFQTLLLTTVVKYNIPTYKYNSIFTSLEKEDSTLTVIYGSKSQTVLIHVLMDDPCRLTL